MLEPRTPIVAFSSPLPVPLPFGLLPAIWLSDEKTAPEPATGAVTSPEGSAGVTRRSILIVEDDADSRETFCALLEEAGYECVAVANGREAIDYLRAHSRPFAILLDLMMPQMDGWQFRRLQMADPALGDVPLVVVSAAKSARNSALQFGADRFLLKPVDPIQLVEAFANLPS